MITWYATNQLPGGAIPASPDQNGEPVLFDYNAYWVEDLYDYILYTGDLELANQLWPNLVALMNEWYPAQAGADGLLVNSLGAADYALIPRLGDVVAYYNAGYVRALRFAAQIATWIDQPTQAATWLSEITPIASVFSSAFWDASAGAFKDATSGAVVHPEDGNVFAILAGLATTKQARSALDYLTYHDNSPYGATIADNNAWDSDPWGDQASQRIYPFMSYFEVLARFQVGFSASALNLIRIEWGNMLAHSPTMWETVAPGGATPYGSDPSWDHGWSSGAAPALTNEVLGVTPGAPGFASFDLAPHPSGLLWAKGSVPTPRGAITVSWRRQGPIFKLTLDAPVAGEVTLPFAGTTTVDHTALPNASSQQTIRVRAGSHTIVVTER